MGDSVNVFRRIFDAILAVLLIIGLVLGGFYAYGKFINPSQADSILAMAHISPIFSTKPAASSSPAKLKTAKNGGKSTVSAVSAPAADTLAAKSVDRNKRVCRPINNRAGMNTTAGLDYGKHLPSYYSCFEPTVGDAARDKDGNLTSVGVDFQAIINKIEDYTLLPNLQDCAQKANFNPSQMASKSYKSCSLGYYHDSNGRITLIFTGKDGNIATVQQDLQIVDDGDETTLSPRQATMFRLKKDFDAKIKGVTEPHDTAVVECAKTAKGNVDVIENSCKNYGLFPDPASKDNICAIMPNEYGNDVNTFKKRDLTLVVSKSRKTLILCGFNEAAAKAAKLKAEAEAQKRLAELEKNKRFDDQGHDIRPLSDIVEEIIQGKYANGIKRQQLLGARYGEAQKMVNHKCLVERDPRCVIY